MFSKRWKLNKCQQYCDLQLPRFNRQTSKTAKFFCCKRGRDKTMQNICWIRTILLLARFRVSKLFIYFGLNFLLEKTGMLNVSKDFLHPDGNWRLQILDKADQKLSECNTFVERYRGPCADFGNRDSQIFMFDRFVNLHQRLHDVQVLNRKMAFNTKTLICPLPFFCNAEMIWISRLLK